VPSREPTTENGRIVAGMYAAFGRGEVQEVLARIAPRVEWIETEARNVPAHGTFSTPDEVLNGVFAKVMENFARFELRPELWIESGDDVVVTGRVAALTQSGRELDAPYAHVFTLRDGKVVRNENHHDTALWTEALA
jgi:uncharacterized protein